jgi:membrane-associated protease RseP (regulator of RpoE activity)
MLVMAAAVAPASAKDKPRSSNPAFLGVGMSGGSNGACVIETVTKDSGAQVAGLRSGDVFLAIDGTLVPSCDELITQIQAHEPGDLTKIQVSRGGVPTTITAKLLSRAEVMRQRFVGQPVPMTTLTRVDDLTAGDLSTRGKTTIVGWFDQKNCVGCETVFASLAEWQKKTRSSISVIGATAGDARKSVPENLVTLKQYQRGLDVPLLVTDQDTFTDLAITDPDRIHFMVIDGRGIVQYAAPLAPQAEDTAAVLDELYAAAEQASRRIK